MIPYHPRPKFSVRPHNFRRVREHPLWIDCTFAGLGQVSGSRRYFDTSVTRNHGNDVGVTPGGWNDIHGRRAYEVLGDDSNDNSYVDLEQPPVTSYPLTLAGWVRTTTSTSKETAVIGIAWSAAANQYWSIATLTDTYFIYYFRGGGNQWISTGSPSANTIYHLAGVSRASDDHELYVDGGSIGISAVNSTPLNVDRARIAELGRSSPTRSASGSLVADAFVWQRALGIEELQRQADPTNVMLDGAIEPIPTSTYFLPTGAPPPTDIVTDIFTSAIIGD